MKRILAVIASLIIVMTIAGCSTGATDNKSGTRLFQSEKGELTIPQNPERIVTDYYLGDLLALGVTPVGGTNLLLQTPLFAGKVESIANISDFGAVSFEKVTELAPDLIITLSEAEYDKYSEIAPTILLTVSNYSAQERITLLGDIVNKSAEATKLISNYEEKIAEAKTKLATKIDFSDTVTIFDVFPKDIYVAGKAQSGGPIIYNALGFNAVERVEKDVFASDLPWLSISIEALPDYAGDHIFLLGYQSEELTKQVTTSSIWLGLPAVKNNQVYTVDSDVFRRFDFLSLEQQIDIIVESMLGAN